MISPEINIRPLQKSDIPGVIVVAQESTFQLSTDRLEFWMKHDPQGIKVAETNSGEIVGICGVVRHNENISFGGSFCVLKKNRQCDIGHQLFTQCISHGNGSNIGLNCSSEIARYYRRKGLNVQEDSWSTVEYEHFEPVDPSPLSNFIPKGVNIEEFSGKHLQAVYDYDYELVGYDRKQMLKANCEDTFTKTLVAFRNGVCVGFGSAKKNIFGHCRVGPLYADESAIAEVMMRQLLDAVPPSEGLALVTMSSNFAANQFLKKLDVPVHDNLLRLYSKEKMKVDTSKIFAQFDVDFSPF